MSNQVPAKNSSGGASEDTKVKSDAADPLEGHLDAKVDDVTLEVDSIAHKIKVHSDVTDAITQNGTDITNHKANNGDDHSFIDQDVKTSAGPTFISALLNNFLRLGVTPSGVPSAAGVVSWNPQELTMNIDTGLGPVLQIGQEFFYLIYNNTAGQIDNGTVLRPVGAVDAGGGQIVPTVEAAQADVFSSCEGTIMMATMNIPISTIGLASGAGRVRGLSLGALTPGADAYLSATVAGGITNTRPTFPNYEIKIGAALSATEFVFSQTTQISETINNFWNGVFRESFDFLVTSSLGIITGKLRPTNGHTDMTMMFSDGLTILPTDAGEAEIELTAGPDDDPQKNYIYILQSDNQTLVKSLSGFPTDAEHIKIADLTLQTAATTETDGALENRNWNDHIQDTTTNQGHLSHMSEKLRRFEAQWESGCNGSLDLASLPTDVFVKSLDGIVYQMHRQVWDEIDLGAGGEIRIVNHPTTPFLKVTNLNTQILDASGGGLDNKSFSFVMWGIQNKSGEPSQLMLNLPSGTYNRLAPELAVSDANNYSVYTIPKKFQGTGFLIARFTMTLLADGVTWSLYDTEDLRGKVPNTTAGGGAGGAGVTEWVGLNDTPNSYAGQANKIPHVALGEAALEFREVGKKFEISNGAWSDDIPSVGKYSFDCVHNWDNIIMSAKADLTGSAEPTEIGFESTSDAVSGTRRVTVGFKPLGTTTVNIMGWND